MSVSSADVRASLDAATRVAAALDRSQLSSSVLDVGDDRESLGEYQRAEDADENNDESRRRRRRHRQREREERERERAGAPHDATQLPPLAVSSAGPHHLTASRSVVVDRAGALASLLGVDAARGAVLADVLAAAAAVPDPVALPLSALRSLTARLSAAETAAVSARGAAAAADLAVREAAARAAGAEAKAELIASQLGAAEEAAREARSRAAGAEARFEVAARERAARDETISLLTAALHSVPASAHDATHQHGDTAQGPHATDEEFLVLSDEVARLTRALAERDARPTKSPPASPSTNTGGESSGASLSSVATLRASLAARDAELTRANASVDALSARVDAAEREAKRARAAADAAEAECTVLRRRAVAAEDTAEKSVRESERARAAAADAGERATAAVDAARARAEDAAETAAAARAECARLRAALAEATAKASAVAATAYPSHAAQYAGERTGAYGGGGVYPPNGGAAAVAQYAINGNSEYTSGSRQNPPHVQPAAARPVPPPSPPPHPPTRTTPGGSWTTESGSTIGSPLRAAPPSYPAGASTAHIHTKGMRAGPVVTAEVPPDVAPWPSHPVVPNEYLQGGGRAPSPPPRGERARRAAMLADIAAANGEQPPLSTDVDAAARAVAPPWGARPGDMAMQTTAGKEAELSDANARKTLLVAELQKLQQAGGRVTLAHRHRVVAIDAEIEAIDAQLASLRRWLRTNAVP